MASLVFFCPRSISVARSRYRAFCGSALSSGCGVCVLVKVVAFHRQQSATILGGMLLADIAFIPCVQQIGAQLVVAVGVHPEGTRLRQIEVRRGLYHHRAHLVGAVTGIGQSAFRQGWVSNISGGRVE